MLLFFGFLGLAQESARTAEKPGICNCPWMFTVPKVSLGKDNDGGLGTDSLLALKLPSTGKYILVVNSEQGEGEYKVRFIEEEK